MTDRTDIKRMMLAAGAGPKHARPPHYEGIVDAFERFHALAVAEEREVRAKACEKLDCAHRCGIGCEVAAAIRAGGEP